MKKYTAEQIQKKYEGVYVEVLDSYDYSTKQRSYEVLKTSKTIRENMTLGKDIGTSLAYCR